MAYPLSERDQDSMARKVCVGGHGGTNEGKRTHGDRLGVGDRLIHRLGDRGDDVRGTRSGGRARLWDAKDPCITFPEDFRLRTLRKQLDMAVHSLSFDSGNPNSSNDREVSIVERLIVLGRNFGTDLLVSDSTIGASTLNPVMLSPWSLSPSSQVTLSPQPIDASSLCSALRVPPRHHETQDSGHLSLPSTPGFKRCLAQLADVLEAALSLSEAEAASVARLEASVASQENLCRRVRDVLESNRAIARSPSICSSNKSTAEHRLIVEIKAARAKNDALWACCAGVGSSCGYNGEEADAVAVGTCKTPIVGGGRLVSADADFAQACQAAFVALRGGYPAMVAKASASGLPIQRRMEASAAVEMLGQLLQLLELGAASVGTQFKELATSQAPSIGTPFSRRRPLQSPQPYLPAA